MKLTVGKMIIGGAVLIAVAALIGESTGGAERRAVMAQIEADTAAKQAVVNALETKVHEIRMARRYLIERLKGAMNNPDSFKVSKALYMDDGSLCVEYRATNGFGGVVPGYAVITPDIKLDTTFKAWKKYCAGKAGREDAKKW